MSVYEADGSDIKCACECNITINILLSLFCVKKTRNMFFSKLENMRLSIFFLHGGYD